MYTISLRQNGCKERPNGRYGSDLVGQKRKGESALKEGKQAGLPEEKGGETVYEKTAKRSKRGVVEPPVLLLGRERGAGSKGEKGSRSGNNS